jgi:hypothetical protein
MLQKTKVVWFTHAWGEFKPRYDGTICPAPSSYLSEVCAKASSALSSNQQMNDRAQSPWAPCSCLLSNMQILHFPLPPSTSVGVEYSATVFPWLLKSFLLCLRVSAHRLLISRVQTPLGTLPETRTFCITLQTSLKGETLSVL